MSSFPRRMSVYSLFTLLVLPFGLGSAPGAHAQVWEVGQKLFSSNLDGSRVGQVLAVGDFNGDGYQDLLAGTTVLDQGTVHLFFGGQDGLGTYPGQGLVQKPGFRAYAPDANDHFGSAVAMGNFDRRGQHDLAVGVSGWDNAGSTDGGAIQVLGGALYADGWESGGLVNWSSVVNP